MIQLQRNDNMSVCLTCDRRGLASLTDVMQGSDGPAVQEIEATFDKSIVTLKRKSPTVSAMLVVKAGDQTRFSFEGDDLVWTITDEDRDCVLSRLEQCAVDGSFDPAELIRVQVSKNRNLDYLYAELVTESGFDSGDSGATLDA